MHTTWAAWQALLYFDGETEGDEREGDGEGRMIKKKKEHRRASEEEKERKIKRGMRDGSRVRLTLGLLHKHDLGVRQEVVATQEHPLTPCSRLAVQALLLHRGQLLGRALGCLAGPALF